MTPSIPAMARETQSATPVADPIKEQKETIEYIQQKLTPVAGAIPHLRGIDIYGKSVPYNGITGGDLITYVDFAQRYDLDERIRRSHETMPAGLQRDRFIANLQRNKRKGGVLVGDVAAHRTEDAARAFALHVMFHMAALYEMDMHGEITEKIVDHLNIRFCQSETIRNLAAERDLANYITAIYGEIHESGRFRFVSAGHPVPLILSHEYGKFVDISEDRIVSCPPLGMEPNADHPDRSRYRRLHAHGYKGVYQVNELNLMGRGDIMLLRTDGLLDAFDEDYETRRAWLERTVLANKDGTSKDITDAIIDGYGRLTDDLSVVVIKKL